MSRNADCGQLMACDSDLDLDRAVTESGVFKDAELISMVENPDETRIVGPNTENLAQNFSAGRSGQPWEVKISSGFENLEETLQDLPVFIDDGSGASTSHASATANSGKLKPIQVDVMNEVGCMEAECENSELQQIKREAIPTISVTSSWELHEKSQETLMVFEPESVMTEGSAIGEKRGRGRKRKQVERGSVNEFSKTRIHLRYLLHRIKYEQSLIDAYSAEGWKGQSLEKLKPEKELQNAKSHILRYKLKIRELFQHIDRSLSVGKLPESLFDSNGEIYSEDIFCAKCGAKDLQVDNDIILCDGACQRGFHQFCLEPPLLKEQIPPGDEAWLCPGCICKHECIHMLKDFQESKVSILDNWEKIFPEAVVASSKKQDDIRGSSPGDSEDNDYDPDKRDKLEKVIGHGSSSVGCPDLSAPEDLVTPDNEKSLVLPSDDSEDDDFDPAAPDKDEIVDQDSSTSDFSSDSDDLGGLIDDAVPGVNIGNSLPPADRGSPSSGCNRKKSDVGGMASESQKDDLSYLFGNSDGPSSSRRHVERLDYKELHDETFGNCSDSSDEDFDDTMGTKRWNKNRQITVAVSPYKTSVSRTQRDMMDENQEEIQHRPERTHKRLTEIEIQNSSAVVNSASADPKTKRSTYKVLGEAQTQRLFESFQENQYPERAVKENLAKELGLSIQQVYKWFDNTRWRFHHRPQSLSFGVGTAPINITSFQGNEPELEKATSNPHCSSLSGKFSS